MGICFSTNIESSGCTRIFSNGWHNETIHWNSWGRGSSSDNDMYTQKYRYWYQGLDHDVWSWAFLFLNIGCQNWCSWKHIRCETSYYTPRKGRDGQETKWRRNTQEEGKGSSVWWLQQVQHGEETCANTPSFPMLRVLVSMASVHGWSLASCDASTAFLFASLPEGQEVSCRPPNVLVRLGLVQPGIVWKLKKDFLAFELLQRHGRKSGTRN